MTSTSTLTMALWLLTTDYIVNIIIAIVFPFIAIGIAVKFFRNLDNS